MKTRLLIAVALTSLLSLTSFASASAVGEQPSEHEIIDFSVPVNEPFREWDDERLLAAKPIELPVVPSNETGPIPQTLLRSASPDPIVIVDSVAPISGQPRIRVNGAMVPSTVGRLASVAPNGEDYFCSASVVNSDTKNIVYTAAHCVYNKNNSKYGPDGWHSDFVFIPAYYEKLIDGERVPQKPFGEWTASRGSIFQGWTIHHDRSFDQAFLTLDPSSNGEMLQDLTGGNGLTYNEPKSQLFVNAWGYPRLGVFETQKWRPHVCSNGMTASDNAVPNGVRMMCDMTAGSSGGPWIRGGATANYGYVVAVTSSRPELEQNYIYGAPNTEDTEALYKHREEQSQ